MILLSHPTGNANVRGALHGLQEAGLLSAFSTSIATFDNNIFGLFTKLPGGSVFNRRRYPESLREVSHQYPWDELIRLIAVQAGLKSLVRHETGLFSIENVCQKLDWKTASEIDKLHGKLKAVYSYEDVAVETFKKARKIGLRTIYDLPIGYWRSALRIQSEEADLQPEWPDTMPALKNSDEKLARKEEELQLASDIIVASTFTAATLKEAPFELPPPVIIPYGCPTPSILYPQVTDSNKLKVLFVGGLSQRKGLSYLLDAIDMTSSICDLTLVGRKPDVACKPLNSALEKHRWFPSLPHEEILAEMRKSDVLVFPSLFEGFGLVVTEALSQGIPVITTPNTCGPDVLTDSEDGFIVPIRDSGAIAEKLEILHKDREKLDSMKVAAKEKAMKLTWETYSQKLAEVVACSIQ